MNLLQIHPEVLSNVFDHLDFRSLLTCRKVSHDFRNIIDELTPSSYITEILIRINTNRISLRFLDPKSTEKWTEIKYKNHRKGCSTIKNIGVKKIKKRVGEKDSPSFVNVFWEDVNIILKHQKSILEKFSLVFEHYEYKFEKVDPLKEFSIEIMEKFKETLKGRPRPLQVKIMDYGIIDQMEVMTSFPFTCAESLEKIVIGNSRGLGEKPLKIDEIVKLKQWKNAKEIQFNEFLISSPIQNFSSFSKVSLSLDTVTNETIKFLREMFNDFMTMNYFEIYYNPTSQDLRTLFGHRFDGMYVGEDGGSRSYFNIPENNEEVISVQSNLHSWLRLIRVKKTEL